MSATMIDLSKLSLESLKKLRAGWKRQFERWGSVDKSVATAIKEINAEIRQRRAKRDGR